MKPQHLLNQVDRGKVENAIQAAELKTSGEIRVVIHEQPAPDAMAAAQGEFLRMGMQRTAHRNAVLIFLAPASQTFAVIGDEGVHRRCGGPFWQELAAAMTDHFKRGEFTAGLVGGIERAGVLLAAEFPRQPDDRNELPDGMVTRGPVI